MKGYTYKIKNILFLTTTPTVGGNGDALTAVPAMDAPKPASVCRRMILWVSCT